MDVLKNVSQRLEKLITPVLTNPYIMAVVKLSLVLYSAQIAPKLPTMGQELLNNTFVKMLAIMMIVYVNEYDFQLAIILAITYVLSMNALSGRQLLESFADYSPAYEKSGQKLIEPQTSIYPACTSFTMADLDKVFSSDRQKLTETANYAFKELFSRMATKEGKEVLMKIAYAAGLPYNKDFTDENAPYIATILVYQGMQLSETCAPPK